jgi:hypothetical protein
MESDAIDQRVELPEMSAVDADEISEYRAPSILAFLSLLFGLASPSVFVGPLLYAIPVISIMLALLALRQIALSEGSMTGRSAAILGIVLSTIFLFASGSNAYVTSYLLRLQARSFAEQWFAHLQAGATNEAIKLTRIQPVLTPDGDSAGERESLVTEEQRRLDRFVENPVVQKLVSLGSKAKATFAGDLSCAYVGKGTFQVEQIFKVTVETSDGPSEDSIIHISMERYPARLSRPPYWLVLQYNEEAAHDHYHHH